MNLCFFPWRCSLTPIADVLNRFPRRDDTQYTVQIMRYMFPRQFGLHNVFTSKVDKRETAMPFKDYTLREKEIHQKMCKDLGDAISDPDAVTRWKQRVPKRLRGDLVSLIAKMRILNQRCSYTKLLRHYCPVEVSLLARSLAYADNVDCPPFFQIRMGEGSPQAWCDSTGSRHSQQDRRWSDDRRGLLYGLGLSHSTCVCFLSRRSGQGCAQTTVGRRQQ